MITLLSLPFWDAVSCSLVQIYQRFAGRPATLPWGHNEFLQILPYLCQTAQHWYCVTDQTITNRLLTGEPVCDPMAIHVAFVVEVVAEGQVFFPPSTSAFPGQLLTLIHPSNPSASSNTRASHHGRQYSSVSPLWERHATTLVTVNTDIHLGLKGNFKFAVWWRVGGVALGGWLVSSKHPTVAGCYCFYSLLSASCYMLRYFVGKFLHWRYSILRRKRSCS
jgi:hypothetical protein